MSENGVYPIYSKYFLKSPSVKSASLSQPLSSQSAQFHQPPSVFHVNSANKWLLWHHRLGHPSDKVLSATLSSIYVSCTFNNSDSITHCKHCLNGMMHQLPFPKSDFQASKPLKLIHFDVWGLAPVTSVNDFQYYVIFVDEYLKFTWLYLLKFKLDVFDVFKHFKATAENQLGTKIKILKTNRCGEFTSNAFKNFCLSHGLIHQFTFPHTPQQNGVAERKHIHSVECTLTMLSHFKLPTSYWSYAISIVIHIVNWLPTPNLQNLTHWELFFYSTPDVTHLRTVGYACFPLLKPYNNHKLQPHTTSRIFLGYPAYTKGYICLDPVTSRIYISRHVLFNEIEFLSPQSLSIGSILAQSGPTQSFHPIIL